MSSSEVSKEIEKDVKNIPVIGVTYKKHHNIPFDSSYLVLNEILERESGSLPDKALPMNLKRPVQIIHYQVPPVIRRRLSCGDSVYVIPLCWGS